MASYADQIRAQKAAHVAVDALASLSQQQIAQAFSDWSMGMLDKQTVRHRLESIVRKAYRSSAAIAAAQASRASDLPDWSPAATFNTEYLQTLLKDVRRNLREFKSGDETAQRRAVLNLQLSAQVATQRGFTDQNVEAYNELADFGYKIQKAWLANFVNHIPCPSCRARHGMVIGLHEEFPKISGEKVFVNLQGPPGHPRCSCKSLMLISSLETAFEKLDIEQPVGAPAMVTSSQIRSMATPIFKSVRAVLKAIIAAVRRKK